MDDLMNAMLGGAGSQSTSGQDGADLSDLLQGMMGGSGSTGSGGAGGLLGAILGGGGGQSAGGIEGILGSVLGAGNAPSGAGAGGILEPIAQMLSEKLGLSPAISRAVVAFAISKILGGLTGAQDAPASGAAASPTSAPSTQGLELDHLLGQMQSGRGVDVDYLQSSGMSEELAQQTGLDSDTAAASLQEAFNLLGGQLAGGQQQDARPDEVNLDGLDDLLKDW